MRQSQIICLFLSSVDAYSLARRVQSHPDPVFFRSRLQRLFASPSPYDDGEDPNKWISSSISENLEQYVESWNQPLSPANVEVTKDSSTLPIDSQSKLKSLEEDDGQNWIDTITQIAADEISFINTEVDRADKVRMMQEWGFAKDIIATTLGVATDSSGEMDPNDRLLSMFQDVTKKTGFGMVVKDVDEVDPKTVESHTTIDRDEDTGEPIRSQMVYVDEYTCIGCTNCATIAQSTFFMEDYLGRARVFQQWGDDDETIQIAIETCPVDCIHYVPYDELVRLEIERRDQNINFKARLVSQGEYFGGPSHRVGGEVRFTGPQKISGNLKPRCNNCPSRGCNDCPMYGVGKNPAYLEKEKKRKEKMMKKRAKEQLEGKSLSADL